MTKKTPITLVTGFLGSGKSTLLSQVLQDPAFSNAAVIVNEFGEIGLDDFHVTHSEEQVLRMTTGCLCCTVRGDISDSLLELWSKRNAGELPDFERVIVETTGLADPAPVIHTIMTEPGIFTRFKLDGVVTTVDAINAMTTLDLHQECVKQIALADRVVITKTDLEIEETALQELNNSLSRINPTAELFEKQSSDFNLEKIVGANLFDEAKKSLDIIKWLNLDALKAHHDHKHDEHHHHDVNKHGDDIETFSLIIEAPISGRPFIEALQSLVARYGKNLLRIKGVANLKERNGQPYTIHGVQHVFHEPIELDKWPTEDQRTKLVFITSNLPQQTIVEFFAPWVNNNAP